MEFGKGTLFFFSVFSLPREGIREIKSSLGWKYHAGEFGTVGRAGRWDCWAKWAFGGTPPSQVKSKKSSGTNDDDDGGEKNCVYAFGKNPRAVVRS